MFEVHVESPLLLQMHDKMHYVLCDTIIINHMHSIVIKVIVDVDLFVECVCVGGVLSV